MESQRAIRAFLLLVVIQFHCEILLAEDGQKHHSTSDLILGILPEKDSLENVYDDDLEEYPDYNTQDSDDDDANSRQLSSRRAQHSDSDSAVTKVAARRSQSSNSGYAAKLRQLLNDGEQNLYSNSHESQIPIKRPKYTYSNHLDDSDESQFSNSGYSANLRQLNRRAQHSDSDSPVTKVPARRSQSSNSEYAARRSQSSNGGYAARRSQSSNNRYAARRSQSSNSGSAASLRQLLNDEEQNSHSNSHEIQIPTKRPKYTYVHLDNSDKSQQNSKFENFLHRRQSQRRGRKVSPKHKSEHSDHEHTVDLRQSSETQHLQHPETAHVTDQISSRKSEAARRSSKPSLRTFPDSKQQPNARRSLFPSIKLAKLGLDGVALLPQVFLGEAGNLRDPKHSYYEEVRTVGCPEGTHFIIDHCEPIVYFEHTGGAKIKKIVRKSDVYLDTDEGSYEI